MKKNFVVESGNVIIIDPCFTKSEGKLNVVENVKKGSWIAEVDYSYGYAGKRVGKLITKHCEFGSYDWNDLKEISLEVNSDVIVGIFDEKYYDTPNGVPMDYKPEREAEVFDSNGKLDLFYSFCLEQTESSEKFGVLPYGVVIDLPIEIETYECFVVFDENNEIVVIEIVIYEDSEYEYEEGCFFGDWEIDCDCEYCEKQRKLENEDSEKNLDGKNDYNHDSCDGMLSCGCCECCGCTCDDDN